MTFESDIANRPLWLVSTAEPDWDAVYTQQLPRIYNFFRYRIGNSAVAEDLTSRTFEKAWSARRRYRKDVAGFGTWLLAIARNVAIDHLRSQRRHLPLEAAAEVADARTPEEEQARESDLAQLAALMRRLSIREQELLALKYGAGATNRAIAELTGLSESNVGTILHRAVSTLRNEWR